MPVFAIVATDLPGHEPERLRKALLAAHLAHVEAAMADILVAGPLRDADGRTVGSLLVIAAADADAARAWLTRDPYHDAGIWAAVEVSAFAAVAGAWVGGAAWKATR